ncbi:Rhodanese-like domain-containing protein [Xylaria arbuscula]|nr:Rhodanese-like domain-containing protein [Xylaria arbuscula]
MSKVEPEQPWHAAFPAPKTTEPASLTREQVLERLRTGGVGRDFVLVDVRRNDYEGGTIRGSINLPAQSLFPTIPALYQLFKNAGIEYIIWYCGSSGGRGTRSAAWFNDHIQEQGDKNLKSVILAGGIKGWAKSGGDFVQFMDGYVPEHWAQFK